MIVWEDEHILQMDGGDGCPICKCTRPPNCTLKHDLNRYFPGPVAKTLSSQCKGLGSIPGQGTRSHILKLRPSTSKQINILKNDLNNKF